MATNGVCQSLWRSLMVCWGKWEYECDALWWNRVECGGLTVMICCGKTIAVCGISKNSFDPLLNQSQARNYYEILTFYVYETLPLACKEQSYLEHLLKLDNISIFIQIMAM